jgi:hypothetical protein
VIFVKLDDVSSNFQLNPKNVSSSFKRIEVITIKKQKFMKQLTGKFIFLERVFESLHSKRH